MDNDFDGEYRAALGPVDIGADAADHDPECFDTPAGGYSSTAEVNVCSGKNVELINVIGGLTYGYAFQWQVGSGSTGPFTDVTDGTGAATQTYTTGPIAPGSWFYVLRVTCANIGESVLSDPVELIVQAPTEVVCQELGLLCEAEVPILLEATPSGGYWSGAGLVGEEFDPALAGAGTHSLVYYASDGDCIDSCAITVEVREAFIWYADQDSDGFGDPGGALSSCEEEMSGHVLNAEDDCPDTPVRIGDACDDGDAFTTGDTVNADCTCSGSPVVCEDWSLTLLADGSGDETTWSITDLVTSAIVAQGGPYPDNALITETICVPVGACIALMVEDSGCDGIAGGGWVLRDPTGRRVFDNSDNGAAFSCSGVSDEAFCGPVSTQALTISSCDKVTWTPMDFISANPDPAVSAQWGIGDQTDDGYQFWFFDPIGGYNRRAFMNHATSGGFGPATATRACHLRIGSMVSFPVPFDRLLNVRVRSRVNGVNGGWGPACRFFMPGGPTCPLTKLDNNPLHIGTTYSCGATGKVVNASGDAGKLWPVLVPGANRYRYEFSIPGEGYTRAIQTAVGNYALVLGPWITSPLLCGTYTY